MNYKEEQEFYWNLIHFDQVIEQKFPLIKEKFIEFYGEKYRTLIERKLKNLYVIAYSKPKDIERNIQYYLNSVSIQLQDLFLDEVSQCSFSENFNKKIFEKKEENKSTFFSNVNFLYKNIMPLEKLLGYIEDRKQDYKSSQYKKQEAFNLIHQFYSTNETEEEFLQHFEQYKNDFEIIENIYKKIIDQFNKKTNELKDKIIYYQEANQRQSFLSQQESRKFLLSIKELLSAEDREILAKNPQANLYDFKGYHILFDHQILSSTLITYFYEHYDEIIQNPKVTDEEIGFKKSMVDEYFKDQEGKIVYPSKEQIEKLISLQMDMSNKFIDRMIQEDPVFHKHFEYIKNLPLLNKNVPLNRNTILNDYTFITPNLIQMGDKIELFSFLFISSNLIPEYIDQFLYHELNHVLETVCLDMDEEKIGFNTGMDYVEAIIKDEIDFEDTIEQEKRDFELLSEIMNEMIAQEFHQYCLDSNFTVINTKENSKVKGSTSYERLRVFVEPFYEHFKEEIKDSRINYNCSATFYSKVGYENLKQLNTVILNYNEKFGGNAYYQLMDKIIKKEPGEDVDTFYSFIATSREIFHNMLACEQKYKETHAKKV